MGIEKAFILEKLRGVNQVGRQVTTKLAAKEFTPRGRGFVWSPWKEAKRHPSDPGVVGVMECWPPARRGEPTPRRE